MRKIKKEVVEAIEFKQNNPSLSITKWQRYIRLTDTPSRNI